LRQFNTLLMRNRQQPILKYRSEVRLLLRKPASPHANSETNNAHQRPKHDLVYPQILPGHKRPSDAAQAAHIEWNHGRAQHWLKVLDTKLLAGHEFLCGDAMTIADYFASAFVSLAELTGSDLAAYPNVRTWLGRMKALKSWKAVNEAIDGYGASLKGRQMVGV
jgi:glutathione S-transferase